MDTKTAYLNWHNKAPFGMFVHWGVYCLDGYHEQHMLRMKMDREEYEALHKSFNPTEYDPEEWVLMAKKAGMKYICFTAKHHDGFCMWNTATTSYNITNTPYGKDVLKMLQEACEKHDMALSIYYSIPDWYQENAYNRKSTHQIKPRKTDKPNRKAFKAYLLAQITELMTNYGTISTLFWDIRPHIKDKSINEHVRSLQPNILINNRGYDAGDFATPERKIPNGEVFTKPTEACQSVGWQAWGYRSNEDYYTANFLKQSMAKVLAMGGNYLLNVGPMPNGKIPQKAISLIENIGEWYNKISESYSGTISKNLFSDKQNIHTTIKDNIMYIHLTNGGEVNGLVLDPIRVMPTAVEVINDGSVPQIALDRIPTYHKRLSWNNKYLHINDIDCDKFCGEPVVIKVTFKEGTDLTALCKSGVEKGESRY